MGQSKFLPTGVGAADALNLQNAKTSQTYIATVTITGVNGPIIKKVPHLLGRIPDSWSVVRAEPDSGEGLGVTEAVDGVWDINGVELQFDGGGEWKICFQ